MRGGSATWTPNHSAMAELLEDSRTDIGRCQCGDGRPMQAATAHVKGDSVTRPTFLPVIGLAVVASLLAACGGSSSAGTASGTSATAAGGAAAAPLVGSDYPRSDTDFWNAYIRYTPQMAGTVGVTLKTTNSAN